MKTFIFLTFGFLAVAFYELSGGSDFQPASARLATQEIETATQDNSTQTADVAPQIAPPPAVTKIDDSPDVTRVSLNLTNVTEAVEQETTTSTSTIIDSAETPQIILPSLIATTDNTATPVSGDDIRTVSGNRVNVRGGPSTSYGIVSKLTRGETVRILEDNGDGWVRMQPVNGGETGWMADFLLTSG